MQQTKIPAIDITQCRKALEQGFIVRRLFFLVRGMPEVSDGRNLLGRLCTGNAGCSQRTTNKPDELSSPHCRPPWLETPSSRPEPAPEKTRAVRFGSKADVCVAKPHVRSTPNSDCESRHAA